MNTLEMYRTRAEELQKIIDAQAKKISEDATKVKDAEEILQKAPQDMRTFDFLEHVLDNLKKINIEEIQTNRTYSRYFENTESFKYENNEIYFQDKLIATVTDDRFLKFLEKTISILPFLTYIFARYTRFFEFLQYLKQFNWVGKTIIEDSNMREQLRRKNNK